MNALLLDVATGPIIVLEIGSILLIALLIILLIIGTVALIRKFWTKKR